MSAVHFPERQVQIYELNWYRGSFISFFLLRSVGYLSWWGSSCLCLAFQVIYYQGSTLKNPVFFVSSWSISLRLGTNLEILPLYFYLCMTGCIYEKTNEYSSRVCEGHQERLLLCIRSSFVWWYGSPAIDGYDLKDLSQAQIWFGWAIREWVRDSQEGSSPRTR